MRCFEYPSLSRASLALIPILLWLASPASEKETRSVILGRVVDPQNASVAGATVVVTNTDTNTVMTLTTNDTGYYEANLLLPGNYRVMAEMSGFKKSIRAGIVLSLSTRAEIDVRLEVGQAAESTSVTAEAPLHEATGGTPARGRGNLHLMQFPPLHTHPP